MSDRIDIRCSPEDLRWDFLVVCRFGPGDSRIGRRGSVAAATVHQGEWSKEMELGIAKDLGYTTEVYDLRALDKYQRRALEERTTA